MKTEESGYFNEWSSIGEVKKSRSIDMPHAAHSVEKELASHLNSKSGMEFENLVVRRLPNDAICLEGILRTDDSDFDLSDYLKCALGVETIVNRVTMRGTCCAGEETLSGEDTVVDWS
ncbi:MAG TPA: hypothetical protein DD473_00315 [Planctomycetaceae bacterium]|nr:hypothetical protein [Planctomycetaceae bacterium]